VGIGFDYVGTGALTRPAAQVYRAARSRSRSGPAVRLRLHGRLEAFLSTTLDVWIRVRIRLQPYRKIRNGWLPALAGATVTTRSRY